MQKTVVRVLISAGLTWAGTSLSAEIDNGAALHEKHCTQCHASVLYTRTDRRVKSLSALHEQVRMCSRTQELSWSAAEMNAVAAYLNAEYYRFSEDTP